MDVDILRREMRARYREATRGEGRGRKVPDFREHDGARLQKAGRILSAADLEQPVESLAAQLAQEAVDFERRLLEEAGYGAKRVFLRAHELPNVLPLPDGGVKFRHVFAAAPAKAKVKA